MSRPTGLKSPEAWVNCPDSFGLRRPGLVLKCEPRFRLAYGVFFYSRSGSPNYTPWIHRRVCVHFCVFAALTNGKLWCGVVAVI